MSKPNGLIRVTAEQGPDPKIHIRITSDQHDGGFCEFHLKPDGGTKLAIGILEAVAILKATDKEAD